MPFFSLPTGGSPVVAGTGAPTGGQGNVGDLFIDQANKLLYGPKTLGGWPTGPIDLSNGPTGAVSTVPGPTGAASTVTGPTGELVGIAIGTVTTGSAAVTVTGAGSTRTLSFVVPFVTGPTGAASYVPGPTGAQGLSITGPTGEASNVTGPTGGLVSVSVGTVAAGPTAAVSITGTGASRTIDFTIPLVTGPAGAASSVPGPTGPVGSGIALKGSVATYADLPAAGNAVGDSYVVVANGRLYAWDGTNWTDVGNIVGPTGPQGLSITGPSGAASNVTGPTGAPGAAGAGIGLILALG